MKTLNSDLINLLARLYNLRSDDSIILNGIKTEKEQVSSSKNEAIEKKNGLEELIANLENKKELVVEEGENLRTSLVMINRCEFKDVTTFLDIDFDPENLLNIVEDRLPVKVNELDVEIAKSNDELYEVNNFIDNSIAKIYELSLREEEAYSDQDRLVNYLELALNGDLNVTRDELTSLLERLEFDGNERRELAKAIMFPEDGLVEFNERYNNGDIKPFEDEVAPLKEPEISDETSKADDVKLDDAPLIVEDEEESIIIEAEDKEEVIEEKTAEEVDAVEEDFSNDLSEENEVVDKTEVSRDDVIKHLTSVGFDSLDFTNNDIDRIHKMFNADLVENNVRVIGSLGISKDIFLDNVELFYDEELESKLDLLTSVGKLPQDIYLNAAVLVKYDLNELNNVIDVLKDSGLDPKSVPLMAY